MSEQVKMTKPQLQQLANGKCPGCGGPTQPSGLFPETVMCEARNTSENPLCKMYFCSPEKVARGLAESARTTDDAINEAERLLDETFNKLDPDNERDGWFMVRITKIREALADRPSLAKAGATNV